MCPESERQCSLPKTSNRLKYFDDTIVNLPVGSVEVAGYRGQGGDRFIVVMYHKCPS